MKKISYLIYKILKFFDDIIFFIVKKNFLLHFSDFFNQDFYQSKTVNNKKTLFFVPNSIIKWRVQTLFSKERETIEWIDNFNSQEDIIFWDIGANIGLYSLYAAQKHKNIIIISFEPSTSNLRVLSRNISINKLYNKIAINQFPLNEKKNSYVAMNEPEFLEGWAMNAYGDPIDYEGKTFEAKQKYNLFGTNIDFLLDNKILEIPNYIKIDVDGIEHKILKGAEKYLNHQNIRSISVELNENYTSQFNEVTKILSNNNFVVKHKKHAKIYDNDKKFSSLFNYVFEKK